ncbi:MAG: SMI1/KNR4 family protein [Cytophagales bacterium]|nr:SMI1/KNR4 family protein [Armatimonadota bacterium]
MQVSQEEILRQIKQRIHDPEAATDMGGLQEVHPPTTPEKIAAAEATLGFSLPPLLKRLYVEVANGGFGPGYGIAGLDGCGADEGNSDLLALYQARFSEEWRTEFPDWPPRTLSLAYLGCAMYVVADCSTPHTAMFLFEPNVSEEELGYKNCLMPFGCGLEDWLYAWAKGEDVQYPSVAEADGPEADGTA